MAKRGVKSKLKPRDIALAYRLYTAGRWNKVKCAVFLNCSKSNIGQLFKRYEMNKRYDEIINEANNRHNISNTI